jgi:hypothetical protein
MYVSRTASSRRDLHQLPENSFQEEYQLPQNRHPQNR